MFCVFRILLPFDISALVPRGDLKSSLVPIDERADSRSQIPREKFWGGGKTGREFKLENLLNRFLFMLRIL